MQNTHNSRKCQTQCQTHLVTVPCVHLDEFIKVDTDFNKQYMVEMLYNRIHKDGYKLDTLNEYTLFPIGYIADIFYREWISDDNTRLEDDMEFYTRQMNTITDSGNYVMIPKDQINYRKSIKEKYNVK